MPDFLPRSGAALLSWSHSFDQTINSDPARYHLSEEQTAHYSVLHGQFAQAYQDAVAPGTRCTSLTAAKDSCERELKRFARAMAGIIRASSGISDSDKLLAGVRPPKRKYTRIATPTHAPALSIGPSHGYQPTLFLTDPEIPERIARPRHVDGAMVVYRAGENPAPDSAKWALLCQVTRTRATLTLPESIAPGTKVWIKARYYNPAGRHGPWSAPVSTHIGFAESPIVKMAA